MVVEVSLDAAVVKAQTTEIERNARTESAFRDIITIARRHLDPFGRGGPLDQADNR